MGNGTGNDILVLLLLCVGGSIVLAALGIWLHRQRKLTSRGAALVWAIVTVLPLFGAGFLMMSKHVVEQATGETQSGVNEEPATR
ncbi:hypothetical protein [Sphingomonas rubra]|uniref:Uncharacterized protein n=1 Tax=Sphingomonas rubra TaxID=634430 RepID=A0A1I5UXE7_9SPHN|nr:hypothetical protein [Sphingomonas rubra]SFP99889.1 hypothetical protein SAMN04488241_11913 [Sphingomonas rubra]